MLKELQIGHQVIHVAFTHGITRHGTVDLVMRRIAPGANQARQADLGKGTMFATIFMYMAVALGQFTPTNVRRDDATLTSALAIAAVATGTGHRAGRKGQPFVTDGCRDFLATVTAAMQIDLFATRLRGIERGKRLGRQ